MTQEQFLDDISILYSYLDEQKTVLTNLLHTWKIKTITSLLSSMSLQLF